jgi:DNA-binding CsgD family transcriptional regulator/PAS domain-containing protein
MIENFSRAVDAIYEAALEPNSWPLAMQAIADCFGDVGAVMGWRRGDGGFWTIASPSLAAVQKDYDEKWRWQDIRAMRFAEHSFLSGSGGMTDLDVMSGEEIASLPFYTEFLASYGLCWSAVSFFVPDPEIAAGLGVLRAKGKPPYSREELNLLEKIGRHLERSLRLSMRLFEAETCTLGMRDVLNRLGIGVVALDRNFGVVFANPVAQRGGLVVCDGDAGTSMLTLKARQRIERALTTQANGGDGMPAKVFLEQGDGGSPLTLHVLPVTEGSAAAHDLLTRARILVLVLDSRGDAPPDPALVRDVLSLTLGEARVAALVGSGLSPKSAAEKLGIAESTTRTVLKRVFAKTGVSRQSELVALFGKKSLH